MSNIKLMHGDCLELMKDISDGSVDMILCDLPYCTIGAKWDSVIPFDDLWKEYRRILSSTAAVYLFGTEPFATKVRVAALDLYKYDWIWRKSTVTGFAHARNMPLMDYENIMVFSKVPIGHTNKLAEKRMPYNPQGLKECCKKDRTHKEPSILHSGTFKDAESEYYVRHKTNFQRMVLEYSKKQRRQQVSYECKTRSVA